MGPDCSTPEAAPPRRRSRSRALRPATHGHSVCLIFCVALLACLGARVAGAHGRSISYSIWQIDATGANVSLRIPLLELSRLGADALPRDVVPDGRRTTTASSDGDQGDRPDLETQSVADPPEDSLEDRDTETARYLADALTLASDATACPRVGPVERRPDAEGFVRHAWRVECPTASGALAIRSRILLDVAPSHLHFARVRFAPARDRVREQVLTEAHPVFVLRADPATSTGAAEPAQDEIGSDFSDYLALGVRHILTGWDHLAFLLGLILLSERLATIARLVTGFTLAHSLTLALSVLDLVHPRAAAVEAVIAISVALVAVEKGWLVAGRPRTIPRAASGVLILLARVSAAAGATLPAPSLLGLALFAGCYFALAERTRREGLRIALTFAFGLVHGFGFAGVLVELALPTERLVPALVGFNLGVELGQIGIVLLAWPALAAAGRVVSIRGQRWARDAAIAGLCGLGCFWLIERAFPF